ncbi:MAG: amidohydrolase family protein [Spirochaetes bacterium]|nr:amidohydrolase family protein [Spirochaetota bacterium]
MTSATRSGTARRASPAISAGAAVAVFAACALAGASCSRDVPAVETPAAHPRHAYLSEIASGRVFDLVVRGARVIDPESGLDAVADIGVSGGSISAISEKPLAGTETVEAAGMVAAPGFIDADTISYPKPQSYRTVEYWKLTDGVTTIAWLHDGSPSSSYIASEIAHRDHLVNWGYGIRVDGLASRAETPVERAKLLDAELAMGGLAVGVSPEYSPSITTEDMVAYAKVAAARGVPLVIHTRYAFRDTELDGIREAIDVAERSGARVHLLHFHSTGATWHMSEALDMIEAARARGVLVDGCVYPYSYWMTPISNPNRFKEGWREGLGLDYGDLYFAPLRRTLTKELFDAYRWKGGLVVVPEGTISWESTILPALERNWVFFGSDGSCDVPAGRADGVVTHPRDTGNFATALSLSRTRGIQLATLLRKMTIDPALFLERSDKDFRRRGRIAPGAAADIAIFDPATVEGSGTVERPLVESKGIACVIVNGHVSYRDGTVTAKGYGTFISGAGNLLNPY